MLPGSSTVGLLAVTHSNVGFPSMSDLGLRGVMNVIPKGSCLPAIRLVHFVAPFNMKRCDGGGSSLDDGHHPICVPG